MRWVSLSSRSGGLSSIRTGKTNVFSLGDVAGLPTSKTAGAARGEAPVIAAHALALLEGRPLAARYDGYTVCPLITGYGGSVVMAEFDYSQKPVCSFLVDPTRERWSCG